MRKIFLLLSVACVCMFTYAQESSHAGAFEQLSDIGTVQAISPDGEYILGTKSGAGQYSKPNGYSFTRAKDGTVTQLGAEDEFSYLGGSVSNTGVAGGKAANPDITYTRNQYTQLPEGGWGYVDVEFNLITGVVYKDRKFVFVGEGDNGNKAIGGTSGIGDFGSRVLGVSADGNKAVGFVYEESEGNSGSIFTPVGCSWDISDVDNITYWQTKLADELDPYNNTYKAGAKFNAVSNDGNVIGGMKGTESYSYPAVWKNKELTQIVLDPDKYPGMDASMANRGMVFDVSPNGEYATGMILEYYANPNSANSVYNAFLYNVKTGELDVFAFEQWRGSTTWITLSDAVTLSVNDAGQVVGSLGYYNQGNQYDFSFFYSTETGIMLLADYLKGNSVALADDVSLSKPNGITTDGLTIIGQNWLAKLGDIGLTTPLNGAVEVAKDTEISVKFNIPVTIADASLITFAPAAGNVTANIENGKLMIEADAIAYDTKYTVKVGVGALTEIKDAITWEFTTDYNPADPPVASLSATTWDLDEMLLGSKAKTDSFTLTNTGNAILQIRNVQFDDSAFEDYEEIPVYLKTKFSTSLEKGLVLKPGESKKFGITFNPDANQDLDFADVLLKIETNAAPAQVAISGYARGLEWNSNIAKNQADVPLNQAVIITFDDPFEMNEYASFTFSDPMNANNYDVQVTGKGVVDGDKLIITPSKAFAKDQEYTLRTNPSNIKGLTLTGKDNWNQAYTELALFITSADELYLPNPLEVTPKDQDSYSLALATLDENVVAFFIGNTTLVDEAGITITPEVTGVNILFKDSVRTITVDEVEKDTTYKVLIIEHDKLAYETAYTVNIAAGTFQNTVGENDPVTWTFTTEQTPVKPVATTFTPENDAENVAINTPITVVFDIIPTIANSASILEQVTISPEVEITKVTNMSSGWFARPTNTLTISHADLAYDTEYTVTIAAGTLVGVNAAVNDEITWKFKTEKEPVKAVSFTPANNETAVKVDAKVSAKLNFDATIADATKITIVPEVDGFAAAVADSVLTIAHNGLAFETKYTVTVDAGALSGNDTTSVRFTWSFTTEVEPIVPVAVEGSFTPANEATDIALDTEISLKFNVGITIADTAKVTINPAVEGLALTVADSVLTITHSGLAYETPYTVTIAAGAITGISLENDEITWSFTTEVEPVAPVAVEGTFTPANEATDIALDTEISVKFNVDITIADTAKVTINPAVEGLTLTVADSVLTITHNGLAYATPYTVTIAAGAITGISLENDEITWSFTTETETGLGDVSFDNVMLYPNPATTQVMLRGLSDNTLVTLFDLSGRSIKQYKASKELNINVDFESGTYFVKIDSVGNESIVKKLIVK